MFTLLCLDSHTTHTLIDFLLEFQNSKNLVVLLTRDQPVESPTTFFSWITHIATIHYIRKYFIRNHCSFFTFFLSLLHIYKIHTYRSVLKLTDSSLYSFYYTHTSTHPH